MERISLLFARYCRLTSLLIQVKWSEYRSHLSSHVVYNHRKGQATKKRFGKSDPARRDDLTFQGNLDNPPELDKRSLVDMVEPTDGRWPYSQPNIYRFVRPGNGYNVPSSCYESHCMRARHGS